VVVKLIVLVVPLSTIVEHPVEVIVIGVVAGVVVVGQYVVVKVIVFVVPLSVIVEHPVDVIVIAAVVVVGE